MARSICLSSRHGGIVSVSRSIEGGEANAVARRAVGQVGIATTRHDDTVHRCCMVRQRKEQRAPGADGYLGVIVVDLEVDLVQKSCPGRWKPLTSGLLRCSVLIHTEIQ